jgi:hypothetical protein
MYFYSLYCRCKITQNVRTGKKAVLNYKLQIKYRQIEKIYGHTENGKGMGLLTLQSTAH